MKNDDLQNLILFAVKRGYTIRFKKPFGYEYLLIRVEKELLNGAVICRDRATAFTDIDRLNVDVVCTVIKEMIEEFEKIWEEQNND